MPRAACLVAVALAAWASDCTPGLPLAPPPPKGSAVDLARWIPEIEQMVLVPGGEIELEIAPDERPPGIALGNGRPGRRGGMHQTMRIRPFFLDRFEVTNGEYDRFLRESGYHPRNPHALLDWVDGHPAPGDEDRPVVFVDYFDAQAYARYHGKRLPSTAEWEWASRGNTLRSYPWGKRFNRNRLNCLESGIGRPCLVGTFETGRNPLGCYDLAGNVWEWTWLEWKGELRTILKGGSYRTRAGGTGERPFARLQEIRSPTEVSMDAGFRCARDVTPEIVSRYLDLLHQGDAGIRKRVLEELSGLDVGEAVRALRQVQRRDPDTALRVWAAQKLLLMGHARIVDPDPVLDVLAGDPRFETRLEAADCLALLVTSLEDHGLGGARPRILRILRRFLARDPGGGRRAGAPRPRDRSGFIRDLADLLIDLGEWRVFPLLEDLLEGEGDADLRVAAAERLGRIHEEIRYDYRRSARALFEALERDPDRGVREAARTSLEELPPGESGPILIEALRSHQPLVFRRKVAYLLAGYRDPSAVAALGAVLAARGEGGGRREPMELRGSAAESLGWIGGGGALERAAVRALEGGLRDPVIAVRRKVLNALIRLGRLERAERHLLDELLPELERRGAAVYRDRLRLGCATSSVVRGAALAALDFVGRATGIGPGAGGWPYALLAGIADARGRPPSVWAEYVVLAYRRGFNAGDRLGRRAGDVAGLLESVVLALPAL